MRAARGGAKQLYFVYADFVTRSLCDTLSSQRWHLTAGGNWPGGALVTQFLTGFQERTHDFPCTRVPPLIHLRAINNDNNINNVDVGGAEDNDGGERTFSPGSFDRVRTYVRIPSTFFSPPPSLVTTPREVNVSVCSILRGLDSCTPVVPFYFFLDIWSLIRSRDAGDGTIEMDPRREENPILGRRQIARLVYRDKEITFGG